jgi:uncharacterized membrane protein YcaP (DUF421 family)
MNAGDNSLTAGLILATVLVVLNGAVGYATFRSRWLERLVEGRPVVLIHNGRLYESVLQGQRLTHHELMAALRRAGCGGLEQVHVAILENNGQISVVPLAEKPAAGGAG